MLRTINMDKKIRNLFTATVISFIVGFTNILLIDGISFCLYRTLDYQSLFLEHSYSIVIASQVIYTILFYWLVKEKYYFSNKLASYTYGIFTVITVLSNFIVACFDGLLFADDFDAVYALMALYATALLIVIVFACAVIYCKNIQSLKDKELEVEMMHQQEKSYDDLLSLQKETQALRHDMKHFFEAYKAAPLDNTLMNKIQKYTQETFPVLSSSPALNLLLTKKKKQAEEMRINFSINVNYFEESPLKQSDLYLLTSNMLDNAFTHVGKDRRVYFTFLKQQEMLFIECSNSIDEPVLDEENHFLNNNNDFGHGFGIKTMKMIAEKYQGFITFYENEKYVYCTVMIPIYPECIKV